MPSIDLMKGRAVQLVQGKKKVLEVDNPLRLAKKFAAFGRINVIDLDAAFGKGDNTALIMNICKTAPCIVGGGIKDAEKAKLLIKSGAKKIIIGSMAFENNRINKGFLEKLKKEIGRGKIIIAIDSKKGRIVTKGWRENTGIRTERAINELEHY